MWLGTMPKNFNLCKKNCLVKGKRGKDRNLEGGLTWTRNSEFLSDSSHVLKILVGHTLDAEVY